MEDKEPEVLKPVENSLAMRKLPSNIKCYIDGKQYFSEDIGMSESDVYILEDAVLKIQKQTEETDNEVEILKWLAEHAQRDIQQLFPSIIHYEIMDGVAYTLMTRIKGDMLCDTKYMLVPELLVKIVAEGLKSLWKTDVKECGFVVSRLNKRLEAARYNVEHNLVDMDNVEPETFGENGFANPMELLKWLEENKPEEDIVFTHGDYCLPNIFTDGKSVNGFIDLGKAGPADRWQDIALCLRSLKSNFEGRYNGGKPYEGYEPQMLLDELGITMDEEKNRYYLLLDELF